MIELAEESFDARNDPRQLDVNEEVIKQLQRLHPATVSEYDDGKGPAVWILLIPTTAELMHRFLRDEIGETELLDETAPGTKFEAIYLCSAMVLEEHRGKGIAKKLTLDAIEKICAGNPVETLFVWPFSKEGEGLARTLARASGKKLLVKEA